MEFCFKGVGRIIRLATSCFSQYIRICESKYFGSVGIIKLKAPSEWEAFSNNIFLIFSSVGFLGQPLLCTKILDHVLWGNLPFAIVRKLLILPVYVFVQVYIFVFFEYFLLLFYACFLHKFKIV